MSVLIKGIDMPKESWDCPCHNGETGQCKVIHIGCYDYIPKCCPLVEVPTPHGDLIDKHKLYKKTAEWEAQALEQVRKLSSEEDHDEWLKCSAALNERTAFKFDVYDAETIVEKEDDHV